MVGLSRSSQIQQREIETAGGDVMPSKHFSGEPDTNKRPSFTAAQPQGFTEQITCTTDGPSMYSNRQATFEQYTEDSNLHNRYDHTIQIRNGDRPPTRQERGYHTQIISAPLCPRNDYQTGLSYISERQRHNMDRIPPPQAHRFCNQYHHPNYQPPRPQRQTNYGDIKIPIFTGKEDWSVWINRFEVIAERNRWDEDEMIDQILP